MGSDTLGHKRLPNLEVFDEITFKVVPRHKESEMSGDEWRTSVAITFRYKGETIATYGARDMDAAFVIAAYQRLDTSSPFPDTWLTLEAAHCDQPGCSNVHDGKRYILKRETASDGSYLDPSDIYLSTYRRFCTRHCRRGDCSREDSDGNYEVIDDAQ